MGVDPARRLGDSAGCPLAGAWRLAGWVMDPVDEFFGHYYRRRPVNATFTGVHDYDGELPDWSASGLATIDAELRDISARLEQREASTVTYENELDVELIHGYRAIQASEHSGSH